MANELQAYTTTGKTLYAILISSTGQAWNGAAFEAIQSGNWTTYDLALTEATAGLYLANLPAVAAGIYSYVVFEQAGGSPAITDTKLGVGYLNWDGTAILPLSTIDTVVDTILVNTGTTIPDLLDTVVLTEVAAADVWGYDIRTLTNQGTSVESPAIGDPLEIYRDTTVSISLTSLGNVSGYTNIWFTVKEDLDDADTESIIQIDMTTGLLYIDGSQPTTADEGSIVFSDEVAGDCTITIAEEAAADLPIYAAYPLAWDIKILKSGVVSILSYGSIYIHGTPTRSII